MQVWPAIVCSSRSTSAVLGNGCDAEQPPVANTKAIRAGMIRRATELHNLPGGPCPDPRGAGLLSRARSTIDPAFPAPARGIATHEAGGLLNVPPPTDLRRQG